MKLLVLTGSPHQAGTTALLADEFCAGAQEAGHTVARFDTGLMDIHPCIGCRHCKTHNGVCTFDDGMTQIYPHVTQDDAIAFITPLYYYGMTAQLKAVLDRMAAHSVNLREWPRKVFLICAGSIEQEKGMDGVVSHLDTMCHFLHWDLVKPLLVLGAPDRASIAHTEYPRLARELGRNA